MGNISFETFEQKANEILQMQQGDSQAIGVEGEGRLGAYKVTAKEVSPEERARFEAVKRELTAALTEKFSVDSLDKLPAAVRETLAGIHKSERLMAQDVQRLAAEINAESEARDAVRATLFERGAAVGDMITGYLEKLVGEGVSLPLRSPLSRLLNDTYAGFIEGLNGRSPTELLANLDTLGRELESLLKGVIAGSFGPTGTDGALAQELAEAIRNTEGRDGIDREAAVETVLATFVPEGGSPLEPAPETLGLSQRENEDATSSAKVPLFEGALEQPQAVADEKSGVEGDILQEAESNKKWFEAQLRELSGDSSFNLKIPRHSNVAGFLQSFLKSAKTVGEFRAMARDLFVSFFTATSKAQPVPLVTALAEACDGASLGAKRLIIHDALVRDAIPQGGKQEVAALRATIRLALDDLPARKARNAPWVRDQNENDTVYSAGDVAEPLAWDPETRVHIAFIVDRATTRVPDCAALRNLVAALKADDVEAIENQAKALGFVHRASPRELGDELNGYTENNILVALRECRSPLVGQADFRLYLKQCLCQAPVELKNGREVYRFGGWEMRPDYVRAIHSALRTTNVAPSGAVMVPGSGKGSVLSEIDTPDVQAKSLEDFRHAFGLTRKGAFKTSVAMTKGHLYLDGKGALRNANRHFGTTVPSTGAQNWRIRAELLDAFRKAGANEAFLARVRKWLQLDSPERIQPLPRLEVKLLLVAFDRTKRTAPAAAKPEKPLESPKPIPEIPTKVGLPKPVEPPAPKKEVEVKVEPPKTEPVQEPKAEPVMEPKVEPVMEPKAEPKVPALLPKDIAVPHVEERQGAVRQAKGIFKRLVALPAPREWQGADRPMPLAQLEMLAVGQARKAGRREPVAFDYLRACAMFRLDPADFPQQRNEVANFNGGARVGTLPLAFVEAFSLTLREALNAPGWEVRIDTLRGALNEALAVAIQSAGTNPEVALDTMARQLAVVFSRNPEAIVDTCKRALVNALLDLRQKAPLRSLYDEAMVQNGGGLLRPDSWGFTEGRANYVSSLSPQADVNDEFHVDTTGRTLALTGLSRSELRDGGDNSKVLLRMLRFGEIGAGWNQVTETWRSPEERELLYRNLVEQTFLANPNLVQAENGAMVEVPVVRLDLGGCEFLSNPPADFTFTFTPPGQDAPRTVTLRPRVAHFCLPIDTLHRKTEKLFSAREVEYNKAAWAQLKTKADGYVGPHAAEVKMLRDQIDAYMKLVFDGVDQDQDIPPFPNFGGELTRLGGRIGVLTALLGDVPAINCNWGRDRTGVMDNECKLVMHKILTRQPLAAIRLKGKDPDRALRTRMIAKTGNWDVSRQVNDTSYPLNLHQFHGSFTAGRKTYYTSGLPALFHEEKIGVKPTGDLEIVRTVLDRPQAKLRENQGGGSCFFYSVIQQLNGSAYADSPKGALKLRGELIAHAQRRLAEMKQPEGLPGLSLDEGDLYVETSFGRQPVTVGVKLVGQADFQKYGSYADVSHGAFLADMLKRPVTIVTAETQSLITFDRDLGTNQPLTGEPIVIYYTRGQSGYGHFRAVE